MSQPDIRIFGAGIIGLALAFELTEAGLSVVLVEPGEPGRGASWASGGMLAPGLEFEPDCPVLNRFNAASAQAWRGFAGRLEAASGQRIDYRAAGGLEIALQDGERHLRHRYKTMNEGGVPVRWLEPAEVRLLEPGLSGSVCCGLLAEDDAQVDSRRVIRALLAALADRRVAWVRPDEAPEAGRTVLAAGAWSTAAAGCPPGPPVRPVKGQMVALQPSDTSVGQSPWPSRFFWGPDVYVIPREDRVLIGASVEEAGFDTTVTAGIVAGLIDKAAALFPSLRHARFVDAWSGLRPATDDRLPVIGPVGEGALIIATGHYRNGILQAPHTARIITDYILNGTYKDEFADFGPQRFDTLQHAARG
ncbi:MAG: glycine oxidase ThiO [Pseudomonadota bacterium]